MYRKYKSAFLCATVFNMAGDVEELRIIIHLLKKCPWWGKKICFQHFRAMFTNAVANLLTDLFIEFMLLKEELLKTVQSS